MAKLETFGVLKGQGKYYEEIVYSLALLYNILNSEVEGYLKDFKLNVGKLNILLVVKHRGGDEGITQIEVSKYLIVTPSNMTKMIDKLEKQGLVCRQVQSHDRRVKRVKITNKGSQLLESLWQGYSQKIKEAVSCLDAKKQKELAGLLVEWVEGARE